MNGDTKRLSVLVLALLMASAAACTSKSDGSSVSSDEFARYWADCTTWCHQQATCSLQDEAQCNATCGLPVDVIKAAVGGAGLVSDDLRRCEEAQKLSDDCSLGLSCADLATGMQCSVQANAATTNCSLIFSAIDAYVKAHPSVPFSGLFDGTYDGTESGSMDGIIEPWGALVASIESPSLGRIDAVGTVTGSAFMISGHGSAASSAATITFSATLEGSSAADAGTGTFLANGTWQSSDGGSGTFNLKSN